MSRKTTKSILSLDEINLLKNSNEPQNTQLYGNLFEVLNNLDEYKAVSLEDLESLDDTGKAALTYNKQSLIDSVKQEWYTEAVSEIDPKQKVRCGLCNTPNKYLFYIRNRLNNNRLNVGSFCMTKFPGIEGYTEYKQQLNQIQRNHKTVARRTEFHTAFPQVQNIIASASEYFITLPILLPEAIYYPLEEVVNRLSLIYNQYVLYGKKPFESIMDPLQLFKLAMDQFEKIKLQTDEFVQKNIDNPLMCKREEMDWLIKNDKDFILRKIASNNGMYTKITLANIYSFNFICDKYDDFISKNKSLQIKINLPQNDDENSFIVSYNKTGYNYPITFKVPFKTFMLNIGSSCIFEEQFKYSGKDLLQIADIVNSKENLESIIAYTANMMNILNYILLIDDQTNCLYLFRRADRAIARFDEYTFLKAYSKYILENDDVIKKYLLYIITNIRRKSWITRDRQIKLDIYDKINRLYKDQYLKSDYYEIKNSGSQAEHVEIPLYNNKRISFDRMQIEFDEPEYIKISKKYILMNPNKFRHIDYAVINKCDNMKSEFNIGDLLLIQSNYKLHNNDNAIIITKEASYIGKYFELSNNDKISLKSIEANIGDVIIAKSDIQNSGKILGCISSNGRTDYLRK